MEISPIKYADLKKIQARFLSNSMGRVYFDYVYEQFRYRKNKQVYFEFNSIIYNCKINYDTETSRFFLHNLNDYAGFISNVSVNDVFNIIDTFAITKENELPSLQDIFDYYYSVGSSFYLSTNSKLNENVDYDANDGLLSIFDKTKLNENYIMLVADYNIALNSSTFTTLCYLKTQYLFGSTPLKYRIKLITAINYVIDFEISQLSTINGDFEITVLNCNIENVDSILFKISDVLLTDDSRVLKIELKTQSGTKNFSLEIGTPTIECIQIPNVGNISTSSIIQVENNDTFIIDKDVLSVTKNLVNKKGDASLTEDVPFDVTVGLFTAGQYMNQNTTFTEFVKKIATNIFNPTLIAPSLSLVYSGTGFVANVEAGFIGNLTLTANFNRGAINGKRVNGFWDANSFQNYRSGAANKFIINAQDLLLVNNLLISNYQIVDGSNIFSCTVYYDQGAQPLKSDNTNYSTPLAAGNISANVTMLGKRKTFYGTDSINDTIYTTSSQVRSLPNFVLGAINGTTFTINIPVGAKMVVISYDATLRDISSIKHVEGLNAEIKSIFTKTTINVEGLNNYSAISTKTYTYIPVSPFSQTATYTVTI